jgi:DNA-binding LacI/PurR family transcriptional regulator
MSRSSSKSVHIGLAFVHSFAYYRRVLRGIWRYVEARPQWQLTSLAPEQQSLPKRGRFRPDGLIVAVNTASLERELANWRRPAVNVSAVFSYQKFPRVGVDNQQTGRLAVTHFLERGLRHFAFVGPPGHLFSTERGEAYCRAVQEAGFTATCYENPVEREFDPLGHRWDLERDVQRWLRKLPTPVGIFTPNDLWGVQVLLACRRAGLRVPEDAAVLGVADVLRHVCVGRRTLERRCQAALGWGIAEEIRRTHVERACRLLTATDLTAQAVAIQAGFSDYRHMALVFRKQFGITPTAYRRRTRSPW